MPYLIARGRKHDFSARVPLTIPAPGTTVKIGRADDVDIQLADRSVSKIHATLEPTPDGRYKIIDLGSKNGLRLDGRRRLELTVAPGQEFGLGNLLVTISGTGPETFRIPEGVPRPEPSEYLESIDAPSEGGRRLWPTVAAVVVVLAVLGWALPGWLDRSGQSDLPADPFDTPVVEPSAEKETSAGEVAEQLEVTTLGLLTSVEDEQRGDWSALGRELDTSCGSPGCHLTCNEVEFGVGGNRDYGRWARNLRRMKSRRALPTRTPRGFVVPPFGAPPHDAEVLLALSEDALEGVEVVRQRKRLLGFDASQFPFDALPRIDLDTITRMRRAWRAMLGRDPSLAELSRCHEYSLTEVVAEARRRPEFWRARARASLRGRGAFPAHGGFEIPQVLDPEAIPSDTRLWAELLEQEVVRSRAVVAHPYGDPPPYPEDDDSAFVGWLLERVAGRSRPLPPDHYLYSVWSVLWGSPPSRVEQEILRDLVREVPRDAGTWSRILDVLLYAPSMPFPSPPPGAEGQWVTSLTRWLVARDLPPASVDAVAASLASGALDPRLVLRACLTSNEFVQLSITEKQAPSTRAAPETIRIEVLAPFSVRALLADPERAPRLRKWCEKSLVQIFPDDSISRVQIASRALGRRDLDAATIVSHRALCGEADASQVVVVDGYLSPAIRRLADRVGDGRVLAPAVAELQWLHDLLAVTPELESGESEVARIAGFRFSSQRWEGAALRPATRALLAASSVSARSLVVWAALADDAGEKGSSDTAGSSWREFVDALEIMTGDRRDARFDVWLWGSSTSGRVETVRLRWGGEITRGWVQRESQPARFSHPELQFENFEGQRR